MLYPVLGGFFLFSRSLEKNREYYREHDRVAKRQRGI